MNNILHSDLELIKTSAKKKVNFTLASESNLKITDVCFEYLRLFTKRHPEKLIRIIIEGGGCQGFQYKFQEDLIASIGSSNNDTVLLDSCGARPLVVFDIFSGFYIKDSTFDFENELLYKGFAIKNNPKVKASCGCKKSFSSDEFFDGDA